MQEWPLSRTGIRRPAPPDSFRPLGAPARVSYRRSVNDVCIIGGGLAGLAHVLVQIDDAMAVEQARAPGDGAPMITVRRAGYREIRDQRVVPSRCELGEADRRRPAARLELPGEEVQHRIGTAERLEAAEPEARGLVLVEQRAEARAFRQAGQRPQRRFPILRPAADLLGGGRAACRGQQVGALGRRLGRAGDAGILV